MAVDNSNKVYYCERCNRTMGADQFYTSNNLEHDIYLQNFTNDIIKDLSNIYNIDLSRKYLTLSEIKKILTFQKIYFNIQQINTIYNLQFTFYI